MSPSLARYLNQHILVSIPALNEDSPQAYRYKLVGLELQGLWLEMEQKAGHLLSTHHQRLAGTTLTVFVPFSHIACVVLPELGSTDASRTADERASARPRAAKPKRSRERR